MATSDKGTSARSRSVSERVVTIDLPRWSPIFVKAWAADVNLPRG
jgi:hypothetical protein